MTQYFATVAKGLEFIAAQELERLGAHDVRPDFAGVHFTGSRKLLYRVNLWGRTLFRVLVPIAEFPCANPCSRLKSLKTLPKSMLFANIKEPMRLMVLGDPLAISIAFCRTLSSNSVLFFAAMFFRIAEAISLVKGGNEI